MEQWRTFNQNIIDNAICRYQDSKEIPVINVTINQTSSHDKEATTIAPQERGGLNAVVD